jgi:hypothetical protein
MTKSCRLNELTKFFPLPKQPARAAASAELPLFLGSDLKNRLVTFALAHGAISAQFDLAGRDPVLVTVNRDGQPKRTPLTGRARDWHLALDQHARDEDEDECAGLYRFLHARQPALKRKTQWADIGADTHYFDLSQLSAA